MRESGHFLDIGNTQITLVTKWLKFLYMVRKYTMEMNSRMYSYKLILKESKCKIKKIFRYLDVKQTDLKEII
jgi:hypothetical protein